MPIPTLEQWKANTNRGYLHPASAELLAIDRAIEAYHLHPGGATRIAISTALEAWKNTKGNWQTSRRNVRGAVDALQHELHGIMAQAMPERGTPAQLNAPPPVPPYSTLTDDAQVTVYAQRVIDCFRHHWVITQPNVAGDLLRDAIHAVQINCGIPRLNFDVIAMDPGYLGFFQFASWKMQINRALFTSYDMAWDPPTSVRPHAYFINIAETIYHEARHCEQWWHMARYAAPTLSAHELASQLGIAPGVANLAKATPMRDGDQMQDLTVGWYQSVYGGGKRDMVLSALALNRSPHVSPKVTPNQRAGAMIHEQYSGDLPEEQDAWAIQQLVRAKF
jgi:hypothetical protein